MTLNKPFTLRVALSYFLSTDRQASFLPLPDMCIRHITVWGCGGRWKPPAFVALGFKSCCRSIFLRSIVSAILCCIPLWCAHSRTRILQTKAKLRIIASGISIRSTNRLCNNCGAQQGMLVHESGDGCDAAPDGLDWGGAEPRAVIPGTARQPPRAPSMRQLLRVRARAAFVGAAQSPAPGGSAAQWIRVRCYAVQGAAG